MSVPEVTEKLALLNTRISGVFSATTVKPGDDVKSDFGPGKVVAIKDTGVAIALEKWTSVGIDAPALVVGVHTLTMKKSASNAGGVESTNGDASSGNQ